MQPAYPSASDLSDLLVAAQITAPPMKELQIAINWAVTQWELLTHRQPFLAGTSCSVNYASSGSPVTLAVANSLIFTAPGQAVIDIGPLAETVNVTAIPDATHVTISALTRGHAGSVTPFPIAPMTTRYFTPAGPRPPSGGQSFLGGGKVLELSPSLVMMTSLSLSGVPLLRSAPGSSDSTGQYSLEPVNGPAMNPPWPYERVNFWAPIYGAPESIAVTGVWGFGLQLPDDAWTAIRAGAAEKVMTPVSAATSKGRARRQEGESIEQYSTAKDAGAFAYETGRWGDDWQQGLWTYRKWRMGVNG